MAGTKATRHPTKTDTLIRTVQDARESRGLDRHRIIPRVSQLPSGGGNNPAGGQHVGAVGNFLDPTGDTMVGPIAFTPQPTAVDNTDPLKPFIDIGIETDDYTTYVLAGGQDTQDLVTIFGANFAGQLLYLQGTSATALRLLEADATNGGNIILNGGAENIVLFGQIVTLIFDVTISPSVGVRGAWRVVSGGAGELPQTLAATMSVDQTTNLTVGNHVEFDQESLDIGDLELSAGAGQVSGVVSGFIEGRIYQIDFGIRMTGATNAAALVCQVRAGGNLDGTQANALTVSSNVDQSFLPTGFAIYSPSGPGETLTLEIVGSDSVTSIESDSTFITIGSSGSGGGGGGSVGATQLDELTDVAITSPINDQVLTFQGGIWINQATPAGGMNTDLSNMAVLTVPTVDLSMNNQSILQVLNIDFDGLGGIQGLSTLDFFQTNQVITSLSAGLLYQTALNQAHVFTLGGGDGLQIIDVGGGVVKLDLQNNEIENVDIVDFGGGLGIQSTSIVAGIGFKTDGATDFMQYNVPNTTEFHSFEIQGNRRLEVNLGGATISGTAESDAVQLALGGTESFISGRMRQDGTDVFIFSGGAERNITNVSAGDNNIIQQGNSSVQVVDAGAGSVSTTIDGALKSTQDASNFALLTSMSMNTQNITGTADILPSLNHNNVIGGSTLFYAGGFFDRITFQNLNSRIVGITNGLEYEANVKHEFNIAGSERFSVQSGQIDIFRTLLMNNSDIQTVRDLIFASSASILDMNFGSIIACGRLTMQSGGDIIMSGSNAKIQGVEDIEFAGGSNSFLDLNFGDAINIDRCEVNGQFNHKGDPSSNTLGFYGKTPVSRSTVDFQGTDITSIGNTLALLLQALGENFGGLGLINTNV